MQDLARDASIRQYGTGNATGQPNIVRGQNGLGIFVENLLTGTLYLELFTGSDFVRFENFTWDLASLPGQGFDANTTGAAALFVQVPRGVKYKLTSDTTTDLQAMILDTGNI